MVIFPQKQIEEIIRICEEGYPNEVCGILLGKGRNVMQIFPSKNINTQRPLDRYELDPAVFRSADEAARQQGLEIIGFYHSHPDHPPLASKTDTKRAWEVYFYLIVSVNKGKVEKYKCWRLNKDRMIEVPLEVKNG